MHYYSFGYYSNQQYFFKREIRDVTEHFNISETQLKRMFREVIGYSVMQYQRKSIVGKIEYHIR